MSRVKQQDPDEKLDYTINYADRLPTGDNIVTSDWEVPDDLTGSSESVSGQAVTTFITGGTAGSEYKLSNRSTSAAGRIVEDYILLLIRNSDSVQ
jgi:hypothetical protein